MATTVLQTFLRLNLLDLAGDDVRLKKLEAAASDLGDGFARAPAAALPVLIAALRVDGHAEALDQVAETIERHWTTYQSAFQGGAATMLYRAVALQALFDAVELQPPLGVAISLILRNFGPLLELGKNVDAVDLLRSKADAAFTNEGKLANGVNGGETQLIAPLAVAPPGFQTADIQKRIDAAVGPSNRAGQAQESPNPHWPNAGQPWSHDFADRLSVVLTETVNAALNAAAKLDAGYLKVLGSSVNDALGRIDAAARRSTSLLWWRQALFSEAADEPYRELKPADLLVYAALDLAKLVPVAYERALESFLTEAVLAVLPSRPEFNALEVAGTCAKLRDKVQEVSGAQLPTDLVISGSLEGPGILATKGLSLPAHQWAVWILREAKAAAAAHAPRTVPARVVASRGADSEAGGGAEAEGARQ